MSDLSVNTAPESVVSSSRKATAQTEVKTVSQADANASARKPSSADVTNFVTSPKGVVDPQSGVYVLQYRDGETGEVEMQYPSKKAVAAYQRGDSAGNAQAPAPSATSSEQAAASVPQNSGGESTSAGADVSSVSTTTTTASTTSGGTATGTGAGSTSTSVDV